MGKEPICLFIYLLMQWWGNSRLKYCFKWNIFRN